MQGDKAQPKSTTAIPAEAPVMFLPNGSLFPNALLPLNIFEEKYRRMLRHCLEHDRMFCVALTKPGFSEVARSGDYHHVASIGLIRACVGNEDGTSQLILQGLARVELGGWIQKSPFRIAQIRELRSSIPNPIEADALGAKVLELCRLLKEKGAGLPAALERHVSHLSHPGVLSDIVAHAFIQDPEQRQELIEELAVSERLRMLIVHLGRLAQ